MAQQLETIEVDETHNAKRLDQFVALHLPLGLSRSQAQTMITNGHVTLNGKPETSSKRKIKTGDTISFAIPDAAPPEPKGEDIALDILHEDTDLIVINKPAGLVVHPGAGNETGTLVNALIHHCGDSLSGIGGVKRPGIVHRLDKETSGVMVVAKNDRTHQHLSAQFADHGKTGPMERAYLALVWNMPDRRAGTIETFLGRSSGDRKRQAVASESQPDARHAVTHFRVRATFAAGQVGADLALIECVLETGRTHQIRVHMAHIDHPLVGDNVYGSGYKTKIAKLEQQAAYAVTALNRQALHAYKLVFEHPSNGDVMRFESPLPTDFAAVLQALDPTGQTAKP
ncbi:MAG: RluA family pseudouridine synthase [Pseudomonadota bacterium]